MPLDPTFSSLAPSTAITPNVNNWYYPSDIAGVPDTIAPYLSAFGFQITSGTPYLVDGEFAGFLVDMYRNTFSRLDAMQAVLYAMTYAYNEGRFLNDRRYQDIISGMQQTLTYQQERTDIIAAEFNTTYSLFVADIDAITADAPSLAEWTLSIEVLDAKLDELDIEIAALRASYAMDETPILAAITTAFTEADAALTAYRGEVATLKARQITIQTAIQAILALETSNLATYATEIGTALDALDDQYQAFLDLLNIALANMETAITNYITAAAAIIAAMEAAQAAHETVIAGLLVEVTDSVDATTDTLTDLLALLLSDYTTHATTATAFLTGLGTTELARINQEYAASLAAQLQQLVNRGFYSSALITDVTTRNTREKSERIGKLNDDLNREKYENQHKLYGQQQAMRGTHISVQQSLSALDMQSIQFRTDTTMKLTASSQAVRQLSLQSRGEVVKTQMELYRLQVGVYESFNKIFIEIKSAVVAGLSEVQKARLAVSRGQAGDYQAIYQALSDVYGKSMQGEQQFGSLDAQLRQAQQQILIGIENLGQSWAKASAGMLETGINTRASSAKLSADVRQAYFDILLRQKAQQAQLRLAGSSAQSQLLTSHVNDTTGVAAALFKFAESRDDSFPDIGDMSAVAASMGDNQ